MSIGNVAFAYDYIATLMLFTCERQRIMFALSDCVHRKRARPSDGEVHCGKDSTRATQSNYGVTLWHKVIACAARWRCDLFDDFTRLTGGNLFKTTRDGFTCIRISRCVFHRLCVGMPSLKRVTEALAIANGGLDYPEKGGFNLLQRPLQ